MDVSGGESKARRCEEQYRIGIWNVRSMLLLLLLLFSCSVLSSSLRSMVCDMPGFCVLHYVLDVTQTDVHLMMLINRIILCHPPFPALNLSQNQGLFQ